MKKPIHTFYIVVIAAFIVALCGNGDLNETTLHNELFYSDQVTIGNQIWSTRNLEVATFRNGDTIPEAKTNGEWFAYGEAGEAAWCYYQNDPKNGEKYGKLYNWYAVNDPRGLAPEGWHIPTYAEWTELTIYLGGEFRAGAKMKSKEGWKSDGVGTNSSGFAGLPGGCRKSYDRTFNDITKFGYWWSSTEDNTVQAWNYYLNYGNGWINRLKYNKNYGFSVRCVKDK